MLNFTKVVFQQNARLCSRYTYICRYYAVFFPCINKPGLLASHIPVYLIYYYMFNASATEFPHLVDFLYLITALHIIIDLSVYLVILTWERPII